jgi:hypothetical protein
MIVHLYQQSESDAFRLSVRTLLKTGFSIRLADEAKGLVSGIKNVSLTPHVIFFDVLLTGAGTSTRMSLLSAVFSGSSGTFAADAVSEEQFVETLHDLLRIQPPDNPMKLSPEDYAMASVD